MKTIAAFVILFQYMISILGSDCPARFIDIPTQNFFDEKQFEGIWYHQLHTTYVWGGNEWISGVQSIHLTDVGIYNVTYTAYSKQEKQCKFTYSPMMVMIRKSGSYHFNRGFVEMYMSIVFTDYENALVALCFGQFQDGECPRYQTKYSIWTRSMDFPPRRVMDRMKHLVETQLCMDFNDFREIEQGLCDFKTKHDNQQIETRTPNRPGHLQTEVGVTSANVSWTPPTDSTMVVRGYRLGIGTDFDSCMSQDVGTSYDSQNLANLVPDTDYIIKVTAYNNVGEGMAIYKRIHTLKEQCVFDDIPAQNNFEMDKFLGTWFVTSETTYVWGPSSWTSSVIRLENDHHGHLVFLYSAMKDQHCMHAQTYHIAQTGEGTFSFTEKETARYKIVFTDYQHALVTACFSSNIPCDKSQRQVEVWSRAGDYHIPDSVRRPINDIITNQLCIPLEDFVDSMPGRCHLHDHHDDHDEECDHDNIVSNAHTDITQIVGKWHTHYQTHTLWGNSTWSSKTRVFKLVNNSLVADHYGNSEGDCGLRFRNVMVSQSPSNRGLFLSGHLSFSIVYLDDKFAILYTCAENVSHQCDQSQTHVEVMSRATDKITSDEKRRLFERLCVAPEMLIEEQYPGSCYNKVQAQQCTVNTTLTQENFEPKKFAGTWHTRKISRYPWGNGQLGLPLNLNRNFTFFENGTLHLTFNVQFEHICLYAVGLVGYEIKKGLYHFPSNGGGLDTYVRIYMTDYRYAIAEFCLKKASDTECNKTGLEVMSRDLAPISASNINSLDHELEEGFCTCIHSGVHDVSVENCFTRGETYFGVSNRTLTGKGCQRWDMEVPHSHGYGDRVLPLDNYCRSYDWPVPWCYTLDPDTRWENCSVPECKKNNCVPVGMVNKDLTTTPPTTDDILMRNSDSPENDQSVLARSNDVTTEKHFAASSHSAEQIAVAPVKSTSKENGALLKLSRIFKNFF